MINHVRTLILNDTKSNEFISAEFVPMPESAIAKRVRGWLFYGLTGEEKDWRMHQVMQLLHTPTLEAHVLAYDPRVTYLPFERAKQPGSLVDVSVRLHATVTTQDEEILFADRPDLLELWRSDKMLFDLAGILLALAHHTDRSR